MSTDRTQQVTYQHDLFESSDEFIYHLPDMRNQNEYPQRPHTPEYKQHMTIRQVGYSTMLLLINDHHGDEEQQTSLIKE